MASACASADGWVGERVGGWVGGGGGGGVVWMGVVRGGGERRGAWQRWPWACKCTVRRCCGAGQAAGERCRGARRRRERQGGAAQEQCLVPCAMFRLPCAMCTHMPPCVPPPLSPTHLFEHVDDALVKVRPLRGWVGERWPPHAHRRGEGAVRRCTCGVGPRGLQGVRGASCCHGMATARV